MSDDENEDWAAVKLLPRRTGLPMSVWITQKDGFRHDIRIKVARQHGGQGSWATALPIAVRPVPHETLPGRLPSQDVAFVLQWIELNRDVIIEFWDDVIDIYEVLPRLRRLP
jgi:hypothetical protein